MSQKLIASMPADIDLEDGSVLRVTALDPSSGAVVSGVNVSNIVITALNANIGQEIPSPPEGWTLDHIYNMPEATP